MKTLQEERMGEFSKTWHSGVQIIGLNVDQLRQRLRKMSDEKLREYGEAARYMCSPGAMLGKPPLPVYLIQLEEATAEWRRRRLKVVSHIGDSEFGSG